LLLAYDRLTAQFIASCIGSLYAQTLRTTAASPKLLLHVCSL
jgi:hypothetical protein